MTSVTEHRFIFRRLIQGKNQKIINWYEALRQQAKFCNFLSEDEQIFDQIVAETSNKNLRYRAFESEMSLDDLLKAGKELESDDQKCTRCGSKSHRYYNKEICPAINYRCSRCQILGHYSDFCFDKLKKRSASKSLTEGRESSKKIVKVEKDAEESSKSEKCSQKLTPCSSKASPRESFETNKNFSCVIGKVSTSLIVSDKFGVNVITKKFFDPHKPLCIIHTNEAIEINGRKFSCQLEAKVARDNFHLPVEFYFSDDIDEDFCIVTSNVARKFGVEI